MIQMIWIGFIIFEGSATYRFKAGVRETFHYVIVTSYLSSLGSQIFESFLKHTFFIVFAVRNPVFSKSAGSSASKAIFIFSYFIV